MGGKARIAVGRGFAGALTDLARLFDETRGMVIGGIAVIARGVPRTTRDIDVTVPGAEADPTTIVARLARVGIVPRIDDAIAFATS